MKRVAVFVDAGYLYAQGSACLQGNKAKRENLQLAHEPFIAYLEKMAATVQPQAQLLRIYWYDGTSRGPTQDHRALADLDNLKLRLGFINSVGQQKGVDSLLVTDLVELSRNGAICDAIVLGGDEDLRIGVQIAQSFGVRVHLVGIEPSRGSQSLQLRQESDTKHEITSDEIKAFLTIIIPSVPPPVLTLPPTSSAASALPNSASAFQASLDAKLNEGIESVLTRLTAEELTEIAQALERTRSVPMVHDRRVLASCRTSLGRDLTMEEKKQMRLLFSAAVNSRLA